MSSSWKSIMKGGNLSVSNLMTNKYVLYLVVFLCVTNLLGYLLMGNLNTLIYFMLIAGLTTFFSKNMIVVLSVSLILANIFTAAGQGSKEGFDGTVRSDISDNIANRTQPAADTAAGAGTDASGNIGNLVRAKILQQKMGGGNASTTSTTNQGLSMTNVTSDGTEVDHDNSHPSIGQHQSQQQPSTDEAFEVSMEGGNALGKQKKSYHVDYASTVEDAYSQLNQILGSDGIKRLTDDTQRLMKQQLQLADAMKSMGPLVSSMAPLIEQTKGLMSGMGGMAGVDLKNIGAFASLAKNLGGSSSSSS